MDCLEAQRIISEALDKVPVDDVEVEKAKLHCTTCRECNAFVRTIASTLRAGLPEHDPHLPDRVMSAVRADAEARAISEAAMLARRPAPAPAGESPATPATGGSASASVPSVGGRTRSWNDPATRRSLIAWGSAAAVVIIAAGFFANQGVRQIITPTSTMTDTQIGGAPQQQERALVAPETNQSPAASGEASDSAARTTEAQAGDYIAVNGTAYRRAGTVPDVSRDALTVVGSTTTALDTQGSPIARDVYGAEDPSRVYIERPDRTLIAFDRVTRDYQGRQYALQSGDITSFGSWPVFPPRVSKPTSPDGRPTFRELGVDGTGAQLFEPLAGGFSVGIAVAPDAPAADPSGGNPDWTWWVPIR